jgi:hypothetical protein
MHRAECRTQGNRKQIEGSVMIITDYIKVIKIYLDNSSLIIIFIIISISWVVLFLFVC